MTEEGRQEDLKKGKAPAQVSYSVNYLLWLSSSNMHDNGISWYTHKSFLFSLSKQLQVVLDEAAFLLDLASIEGNWDDYLEQIAKCYEEAELNDVAKFILYKS